MSIAMTKDERQEFLAGVHVAVLSIPQEGGRGPLSAPIWYGYEPGGEIRLVTGADSRKGRLLKPGTRVSFCVQKEDMPPRYVTVEGPITSVERAGLEEDIRPLAHRYLGREIGDQYIAATTGERDDDSQILVGIRPERWLSADFAKQFPET